MKAALALANAAKRLVASKVVDAEFSARELFHAIIPREARNSSTKLTSQQLERLDALLSRRERSEPLQYILGSWDFRQLQGMEMRAPVLCPRPETEELAQLAEAVLQLRAASATPAQPVHFLEVGCGTGAISISLLHNLRATLPSSQRAGVRGTAVDVSHEACQLTLRNAARFGIGAERCQPSPSASQQDEVMLRVLLADALRLEVAKPGKAGSAANVEDGWVHLMAADDVETHRVTATGDELSPSDPPADARSSELGKQLPVQQRRRFDVLIANPPYIPNEDEQLLHPQVRQYEDPRALFGGPPLGTGFTLALLDSMARARLLAAGADVLLEVDSIHPALLADILQPCAGAAGNVTCKVTAHCDSASRANDSACAGETAELKPCCRVRQLHSATGYALPRDGFDGTGSQAVISRDWALSQDWAARKPALDSPEAVDRRLELDDTRAAWISAVATWRPRLAPCYNLERVLSDLYGRPRFVHLKAT